MKDELVTVRAVIVPGSGANFGSLHEACRRIGVAAEISEEATRIRAATHVLLPGVGAAAHAMSALRTRGLDRVLAGLTQPLLGICLGMQLLFESSEESPEALSPELARGRGLGEGAGVGQPRAVIPEAPSRRYPASPPQPSPPTMKSLGERETTCLGLLPGRVLRLPAAPSWPHMGWNQISLDQPRHPLLAGIDTAAWFYFVHGYAAAPDAATLAHSEHGTPFAAIVARGNVHGVQFHPEKSASAGRRLLANFFALT
ncbi:imidazole glycerol phosphate synthase subunit HisH [Dokdonella soli]|uniref:Imidazole glycerol phosphate synthase subunit HisH n=1 Tax=Dokdonella soli TaxID=529810 RepID=A0ABP3U6K9_9GAMM